MAAYAALVSLSHIIDKLELHPHPPLSLHKQQVDSLTSTITFLQEFLEAYNPQLPYTTDADPLEIRIADAAYAAEDVIESHIVDRVKNGGEKNIVDALYQSLKKVIQDMSLIEKEATENKEILLVQHHRKSTPPSSDSSTSSSSPIVQKNRSMVGVDDLKLQMMDNLTTDHLDLQIIPIVGMGGTGKTTLARNISQERLIMEHFDICAWTTISQEYSVREIFLELLSQLIEEGVSRDLSEGELGGKLHKELFSRKYLIIMDDMWSIDAWDRVRNFFPNNQNGSRIIVTTRLSNLASILPGSDSLKTQLLDESDSWELLSKTVFGGKDCPIELEEIGKKIGKSCKGLPLSIVVVGGLLANKQTREFWEYIEENLNSIVNLDDDERCLKLLHLSYKQLPIYLKPCFLYMGAFPEDAVISVAWLIKLWVAEGFLKPENEKSLEEVANEYLKDLCDRNLILIHKMGSIGNIKECKIHDLLRDLCLREARKERFYTPPRFFVIPTTSKEDDRDALQPMSQARSMICGFRETPAAHSLRLLRTYRATHDSPSLENCLDLVNLRLVGPISLREEKLGSSIYRLWNLETLSIKIGVGTVLPYEIWYMPQIRHVQCGAIRLLDPPTGDVYDGDDLVILANLHTLETIKDFTCSEEVVKRIPNIKKLRVVYTRLVATLCLDNLVHLHKLEFLDCSLPPSTSGSLHNLNFPHSLKKLNLYMHYSLSLEEVLGKIGALPLLVKLKLEDVGFKQCKWETVEGQFPRLKFLQIVGSSLERLIWESSHFPCLERLVLRKIRRLQNIPLEVVEISTLRFIFVECYNAEPVICLKRIADEQEELYGEVAVKILVNLKRGLIYNERESWSSPHIDTAQGRVWMQRKYR